MIGIPIEIIPRFPEDSETVFLTEYTKFDSEIMGRIKKHLARGGDVIVTSGFVKAMQSEVIKEITEIEYAGRKILVKDFSLGFFVFDDVYHSDVEILVPHLTYPTNDVWELITCLSGGSGYPLLMSMNYAKGTLYILTIPDDFNNLYHLPPQVVSGIRRAFSKNLKISLEGSSRICLFLYDNNTLIICSFLNNPSRANIIVKGKGLKLKELTTEEVLNGFERRIMSFPASRPFMENDETVFQTYLEPYSYRVFKITGGMGSKEAS
ncbi:MAG: hypothetical protein ACUVQY_10950 [Thermoproteota archaeon]